MRAALPPDRAEVTIDSTEVQVEMLVGDDRVTTTCSRMRGPGPGARGPGTGALGGITTTVDGITTEREFVGWLGGEFVTDDGFTYVSALRSQIGG